MADHDVRQQILVERLPSLLRDIYEGKLLLPKMAPEPWDDERRLRLFERIYRGLPIGGITVWRTSRRLEHRRSIGSVPLLDRGEGVSRDYLVDGLGWVVTLFAELGLGLWLGDKSSRRQPPLLVDTSRPLIIFALETQTFRLIDRSERPGPTEVVIRDMFDAETQYVTSEILRELPLGGQWANQLSRFIGIFYDFSLSVTTVVSDSDESVRLLLSPLEKELSLDGKLKTTRWYCDSCEQLIHHPNSGLVERVERFEEFERSNLRFRLIHRRAASPRTQGCESNGSGASSAPMTSFVGANGLSLLLAAFPDFEKSRLEQWLEIARRLHLPGYERARFHLQAAIATGVIKASTPPAYYSQEEISKVLDWADAEGRKP